MHVTRIAAIAATAIATIALAGCSTPGETDTPEAQGVVLLIPGTTGDGGFFDQAADGVREGADEAGWEAQVVEAGYEPTKWEPALTDLASGDNDIIITGSFAMIELVSQAAVTYPDKQFVLFDAEPSSDICGDCSNVYAITYNYLETGFLAGALAGLVETADGIDRIEGTGIVGVVGGQEIPVIQDYIAGYELGVETVAPDVQVLSAYAGSFADPVKGKAVGDDMVQQGAEILFTAAGSTDKGVIESAATNNVWAIGNATAQALDASSVNGVEAVLTSSDTNVKTSLSDAVKLAAAGELPVGETRLFGVKEGTNSIIESPNYQSIVPEEIREQLAALIQDVADGKYDDQLAK
jgi:basic membrane protein A and related proteins